MALASVGAGLLSLPHRRMDGKRLPVAAAINHKSKLRHYFEHSAELILESEGGPPRWFSPLDVGPSSEQAPVMFYLPGLIGVGLGLTLHHHRLSKIFNIWCLHIPLNDQTSFTDLVKLVESVVVTEHARAPNRPIYLFAESFGGCLALAVASRNPSIDLVLVLANPATSYSSYPVPKQSFIKQGKIPSNLLFVSSFLSGVPLKMLGANIQKFLPLEHMIGEISQDSTALSAYLSAISDVLTVENVVWKLNLVKSAALYANSRLHAVNAQVMILASGRDELLPSRVEAERLHKLLPKCEVRVFEDSNHALFLDEAIDLVPVITGASFYRRRERHDYVLDYLPPTPSEFKKIYDGLRWIEASTDPVMLSTLENGKIVRNLSGIPSEGPVLYVGYHMMLGFELIPMFGRFLTKRNILLRGIAHPIMFTRKGEEELLPPVSSFDMFRTMGAVPASASTFYKLLSTRSHVLLYPGGIREALHRKGEEYKLFWPENSEFVRMAAKFGAKIIPFGSVGEDDVSEILVDYNDLMKIPYIKNLIHVVTEEAAKLRATMAGDPGNQDFHLPVIVPRLPGRFYYYFGKPIETQGRGEELKSRENADELYLQVKGEVEKCLQFLKEKRENDPYRNIFARLAYQTMNGFDSELCIGSGLMILSRTPDPTFKQRDKSVMND